MLSLLLCNWLVIHKEGHSATSLKRNRTGSITCNRSRCHHMLSWTEIARAVLMLLPVGKSMQLIRVRMSTVTALCSYHGMGDCWIYCNTDICPLPFPNFLIPQSTNWPLHAPMRLPTHFVNAHVYCGLSTPIHAVSI